MIKSSAAITAFVLGVITPFGGFIFPPIPIMALVFGVSGLNEVKAGYRTGRGMALTGIFFGAVTVAAYLICGALFLGLLLTSSDSRG